MTTHCMIDLETMGNGIDAAIVAIGAVKFDPHDPQPLAPPGSDSVCYTTNPPSYTVATYPSFYEIVSLRSSVEYGLKIGADTVMWWLQQDDAARKELYDRPGIPLLEAIHKLSKWYLDDPKPSIFWSDSTFDATILNYIYSLKGDGRWCPWRYKEVMDYRTMRHLFLKGVIREQYCNPKKHNALWDAWSQANMVKLFYQEMKG